MSREKRLMDLEESYNSRIIKKEEYLKKKKEIEEEKEVTEQKGNPEKQEKTTSKVSDKILIASIVVLVLLFISVFYIARVSKEQPKTIEDMHRLNIQGKLKPEQGYMYKGAYSFVNLDDFWYTRLTSPSGKSLYGMSFRYSPRDLEDISISGYLDIELFNNATDYYYTFNPVGEGFSHVLLAVSDFGQHMVKVFNKMPIAACDRNETDACEDVPIITCDNTDKIVLYVKKADETVVRYDGNCIIVEGKEFGLVRGVDRILLQLYEIME